MNKIYVWAAVLILILVIGGIWYVTQNKTFRVVGLDTPYTLGTYQYECDEHVTFSMTPFLEVSSIAIAPTNGSTYPPASTLNKQTATSGVRYEGNGVVFTAHGETVTLGEGDSAINCSPLQNPDEAPFNFGD